MMSVFNIAVKNEFTMKKVKQKEVFVADRGVRVAHVALAMMKTKMKNHDIPQGGSR